MKALIASFALVPLVTANVGTPWQQEPTSCLPERPSSSDLQLYWDDSLDGELEPRSKRCAIQIDRVDGKVTGRFVGPVEGTLRTAIFTGEVIGEGEGRLMLLQQREPGYVCSYQLSAHGRDRWTGTWRDSRGANGTAHIAPPELPRTQPLRSATTSEFEF